MENASKALLMAGGILLAVLIISAAVLMKNNLSRIPQEEANQKRSQELQAFNAQFEQYTNKTVYGVDMLSVANMIRDFNQRESDSQKGYTMLNNTVAASQSVIITLPAVDIGGRVYSGVRFSQVAYNRTSFDNIATINEEINDILNAIRRTYGTRPKSLDEMEGLRNNSPRSYDIEKAASGYNDIRGILDNLIDDYTTVKDYNRTMKNKKFECTIEYDANRRIQIINFREIDP